MDLGGSSVEDVGLSRRFWQDKRVLVTGHTGFKGAWLCLWLENLGARITGIALPSEHDGAFSAFKPWTQLDSNHVDVRNLEAIIPLISDADPQIVFHLAAQALVRRGFEDPRGTFETNVLGTLNLLDACVHRPAVEAIVVTTTDKVYRFPGSGPFREDDPLGGTDPYGASKACAEIVVTGVSGASSTPVATARAGNVLGGGDMADDRLLPDLFRALARKEPLRLRNPAATRPWQFVLDPLLGYLQLAELLATAPQDAPRAFNFGPAPGTTNKVSEVVEFALQTWGHGSWVREEGKTYPEATVLELDPERARSVLGWQTRLDMKQAVEWTVAWERERLRGGNMRLFSLQQIDDFERIAQ